MASGSSSSSMSHLVAPMKQTDPNTDVVIAVTATTLLKGNRYVCEVCNKGFPREQNLTLHGRIHNLPFSLKTRAPKHPGARKVYLCPEPTCQHHNLSHGLGDFGGLKKHYLRKHCTQKNFQCNTCSKMYAAETDLKAHLKVCGKRGYVCRCGARFARGNNFFAHQQYCATKELEALAGHSPTLQMGDGSRKITTNSNNSHFMGSTTPYAPTFNMGDNSMGSTRNDNPNGLIGLYTSHPDPHISAFQNLSKSYHFATPDQSQFCPSGIDNESLMTNPSIGSNFCQLFPDTFSPLLPHQNQPELQEDLDSMFYTDLVMGKSPLDNVNIMGDGWNIYENGEGSNTNTINGVTVDQSSSYNLLPGVHNTNSLNGMPNFVCGEGSSTVHQEFDGSYDKGSNYDYGDCSGQSDNGYGMETSNYETSAAAAGTVAPYGQILNQFRGFWF
uniref:protein indeterminate-domain 4, chloroplastic-like n=1 Tax=Erigeron canadensis TaxID=72917 RepID=UPI001CB91101|nr:protein indeterminate-domain 4, chloroplastic-like [Erigeron canadensis]